MRGELDGDGAAHIVGHPKGFLHELLDDVGGKPGGPQPHIDLGGFQILGLGLFQRCHIDGKLRVRFGGELRHSQLFPDIAGQVLVCHLPAGFRVSGVGGRVLEDHAGKFRGNMPVFTWGPQQLRHIGQVHLAVFLDGHRQRFAGGIHTGDGAFRADGAFREHCRLALELPLLVQIFQRTEQIIGGILLKQPPVFAVIQQTVLCGKGIVGGVQTLLRCLDVLIRKVVQLLVNQLVDDLPQLHHAGDPLLGSVGQRYLGHHGIFPVVHLAIHHGVGEVLHPRISGESPAFCFCIRNIRCFYFDFRVLPPDVLHRLCKLVCQHCPLDRHDRQFLSSVLGIFSGQIAQHHLRVIHKILVDGKAIFRPAKLYPCRFDIGRTVPLLQKDNIADNIRASIGTESVVG